MLRPVYVSSYLDTKKTVASSIGGQWLGGVVHRFFKTMPLVIAVSAIWGVGTALVAGTLMGDVSMKVGVVGAALCQPIVILIWMSFNTEILRLLIHSFQAFFLCLNVVAMLVCIAATFDDWRILLCMAYMPMMITAAFIDASPAYMRRRFTLSFFVCCCAGIIMIQGCVQFGIKEGPGYRRDASFHIGDRKFVWLNLSMSAAGNLGVLAARTFWTLWMHPGCLVVITSRIQSTKKHKEMVDLEMETQKAMRRTSVVPENVSIKESCTTAIGYGPTIE